MSIPSHCDSESVSQPTCFGPHSSCYSTLSYFKNRGRAPNIPWLTNPDSLTPPGFSTICLHEALNCLQLPHTTLVKSNQLMSNSGFILKLYWQTAHKIWCSHSHRVHVLQVLMMIMFSGDARQWGSRLSNESSAETSWVLLVFLLTTTPDLCSASSSTTALCMAAHTVHGLK